MCYLLSLCCFYAISFFPNSYYSSQLWGSQGRNLKQLVTFHSQGQRKGEFCALTTQLTFLTLTQSRMDLGDGVAHSRLGFPTSVTAVEIPITDTPTGQLGLDSSG